MNKDEMIDRVFARVAKNFTTSHDKGLKVATNIVEYMLTELADELRDAERWRAAENAAQVRLALQMLYDETTREGWLLKIRYADVMDSARTALGKP